ncbi:MAG: hypothetical protein J1E03_04395 [Acetatifactor sp.]|nr:hypothetical protein [Acetatifactor sp.]
MMTKNLIMGVIKESLEKRLGDGYVLTLKPVLKNNGTIFTGLSIQRKGESLAPVIYLEQFADDYIHGEPLEQIVEMILHIYEKQRADEFDVSDVGTFDKIKNKIVYQLINTAQNEVLLRDIPSVPFLDLSIVFRVLIDSQYTQETASFLVHNLHLEAWGVSSDEVWEAAQENTPELLPANISPLDNVIRALQPGLLEDSECCSNKIYVLSNVKCQLGSCCILYPQIMSDFADSVGSFYILPSSTHEVLLLPEGDGLDVEFLRGMVHDVNRKEVPEQDILSDNVYFFSKDTKQMKQL